jgi:hypothetical protein
MTLIVDFGESIRNVRIQFVIERLYFVESLLSGASLSIFGLMSTFAKKAHPNILEFYRIMKSGFC